MRSIHPFNSASFSKLENGSSNLARFSNDALVESFGSQASDLHNLASMALGSLAFASIRSLANPFFASCLRSSLFTQGAANVSALIGEVAVYRASQQVWHNEGPAWYNLEAFTQTAGDFAILKSFSHCLKSQSFLLRHSVSASAMVLSEDVRGHFSASEANKVSYAQRFSAALCTSIALESGARFVHASSGGAFQRLETKLRFQAEINVPANADRLRTPALSMRTKVEDGSLSISAERLSEIQGWVWDAAAGFDRDFYHLMLLCQSGPEVERELAIALIQMETPRGLIDLASRDIQALFRLTSLAELGCADAATGISTLDALPLAEELGKRSDHFISLLSIIKAGLYGLTNFEQVLERIPLPHHEGDSLSGLPIGLAQARVRALRLLRNLKKICEERGQSTEINFLEQNLASMIFDPAGELARAALEEPRIFHEVFATFIRHENPHLQAWISRLPFAQLSRQLPLSKDFPRYLRYAVERFRSDAAMETLFARAEAGDPFAALNINRLHNDGHLPNINSLREIRFEKLVEEGSLLREPDSLELLCLCAQMGNTGAALHLEAIRNPSNHALIEAHARRHSFYRNQSILLRILTEESPEIPLDNNCRRILISSLEAWADLPEARRADYYEMARDDFEFISNNAEIPPSSFVRVVAGKLPEQFGIAIRAWIYDPLFDYYEILPDSRIKLTKQILKERARNPNLNMAAIEAFIRRYVGRPSYSGELRRTPR